ncbi:MAG: hypothetical protein GWM92_01535, partial [Gemmatimonadetes bacterium]|nr:hypothetical protein [Gemmatimonadota bacterium]NIR77067.1 hypothetical protein [Gemmatimonadota bacterium]NIT85674.1 hypothetical protein [Gemmatimonadota bacterium]NIU29419.1 hypothetical protein [Gemmatimonadota bacterium]NIU34484.1 hypothetical protein [Gemmatimonadota bacterium]
LIIDGVATEAGHPVLSDLARRLHDHEIGVLVFRKGIVAREVKELLRALAADPEEGVPVGQLSDGEQPGRDHLTVHPVGYR